MVRLKKVEELVHSFLKEKIKGYEPHMKLTSRSGSLVVDGIIKGRSGKIGAIVEIRYVTEKSFPIIGILISKFYNKLNRRGIQKRVLMPIVSENMNAEVAKKLEVENGKLVNLLFFKLTDNRLEQISF